MRIFVCISGFFMLVMPSCAGDTSSIMSVWNDGGFVAATGGAGTGQGGAVTGQGGAVTGQGGAVGGQAGQTVVSNGGSGGSGGAIAGVSIQVPGGVRDLATTLCTSASGTVCPFPTDKVACLETNCGATLTKCHYSDGVSAAAGGLCQRYANCMLACPCDKGQKACEDKCTADFASTNPDCSGCIVELYTCMSKFGCTPPTTCTVSASSASS
jgi:hypothetical protein